MLLSSSATEQFNFFSLLAVVKSNFGTLLEGMFAIISDSNSGGCAKMFKVHSISLAFTKPRRGRKESDNGRPAEAFAQAQAINTDRGGEPLELKRFKG